MNVAAIRKGLLQLATLSSSWNPSDVLLNADAFLTDRGAVLVFGGNGSWGKGSLPWSSADTIWTVRDTLVPVWYSGTFEGIPTQFGDYVESNGKSLSVLGRRRTASEAFVGPSPSAIIFVDAERKARGKFVHFLSS